VGKYDEAIQCFDNATELDPRDYDAWYNKGVVLDTQEKYDEAVQAYDNATEDYPQFVNAWINKATALNKLGRTTEAEAALAKAKVAWYNIGEDLLLQYKYDEAI
jgi:tetratricopeptide (TPR) repeat protein